MFNYHYKLYMIIPLLKFFCQLSANFCLLLFLAKRYDEVKNKVCMSFTLNHSEVVEGVFAVVLIDYFGGHCLVFVNLIVVNNKTDITDITPQLSTLFLWTRFLIVSRISSLPFKRGSVSCFSMYSRYNPCFNCIDIPL